LSTLILSDSDRLSVAICMFSQKSLTLGHTTSEMHLREFQRDKSMSSP